MERRIKTCSDFLHRFSFGGPSITRSNSGNESQLIRNRLYCYYEAELHASYRCCPFLLK